MHTLQKQESSWSADIRLTRRVSLCLRLFPKNLTGQHLSTSVRHMASQTIADRIWSLLYISPCFPPGKIPATAMPLSPGIRVWFRSGVVHSARPASTVQPPRGSRKRISAVGSAPQIAVDCGRPENMISYDLAEVAQSDSEEQRLSPFSLVEPVLSCRTAKEVTNQKSARISPCRPNEC